MRFMSQCSTDPTVILRYLDFLCNDLSYSVKMFSVLIKLDRLMFHPLLFQVIRRGDRRPFYAPARYVMEVKTDQARLQVGKIPVVVDAA